MSRLIGIGVVAAAAVLLAAPGVSQTQNPSPNPAPKAQTGKTAHTARSSKVAQKKKPAPLPSGPLGPLPQFPLDSLPAVPPQVNFEDGQLTISTPNSTLGDVLRAVHSKTLADMEIPAGATDRVALHLGPGPAREVVATLLNGSRFNYVLLGTPGDPAKLAKVVLVAKASVEAPGAKPGTAGQPQNQAVNAPPPPEPPQEEMADAQDDNADNADAPDDQAAAQQADQPAVVQDPNNPQIRTPAQMLQELQQRQLQMQQQQQQQGGQPAPPPMPNAPPPQQRENE